MFKTPPQYYEFVLTDCIGQYEQIVIIACTFERKMNGGLLFFDHNDMYIFDTDIPWTNVYRRAKVTI